MTTLRTQLSVLVLTAASITLAGCNMQQTAPLSVQGSAFQGSVYGGQQPIGNATIQLYAAGNSGYGSAYPYTNGVSLLNSPVTTSATGSFSISSDYTCPSASTPVYIVATGGTPNPPAGTVNTQIALMAALGPCGTAATTHPHLTLNELSTVASVYALSPFMTGITNIGTSATNATGLANAFATVNKLANLTAGSAGGPALPPNATAPISKLNTLANILATCVNSTGTGGSQSGACSSLFTDTAVNGVAPSDTITAVMNIAQHPNMNTTALTNLVPGTAPFQPSLTAPPADYSLVVTYSGGGLSTPKGIAADGNGNVWTANSGNNTATEIDALGGSSTDTTGYLSGASGYSAGPLSTPSAVAIDVSGNAWLTNAGNNTVTELNPAGTSGRVFSGGNLSSPSSLAIDASSNIWIANQGNGSITQISNAGTLSNYTGAGINAPTAIAINPK
jgi:hypothetical protein